uniref:Nuclear factor I C n=1 Tax=Nomascus leucogenys TaxID=61853 RepID=A0A2I3GX80_NOMLE
AKITPLHSSLGDRVRLCLKKKKKKKKKERKRRKEEKASGTGTGVYREEHSLTFADLLVLAAVCRSHWILSLTGVTASVCIISCCAGAPLRIRHCGCLLKRSSCLGLPQCWDYRHEPLCPACCSLEYTTDFQESFVTSGVFSVTELIQVSRTPVVTGTGPNFSLGELQGHLAYDLNPASTGLRRTLPSTSSSGSKRHKSGSMEEDVDTSPGGDYYTSPSSPTSSSRNWTEDMEGGISSPVKKTEMDKSPFNSPSPQDSPRLSSFTQHHRPVIAVHSGIARSPHPSSALHFPTTSILPQTASTYFPHTAIRYPPHLNPQDPLKDLVSLACDPPTLRPTRPLQTVPLWD